MLSCNQKITMRQLQILIIVSALGTGFIVLPRRITEYAGSGGWLIVIGLTLLAAFAGLLLMTAAGKRPGDSFMTYAGHFFSKPLAYLLAAGLWLKLILGAGLEIRMFTEVTRLFLLPFTPFQIISLVLITTCAYASIKGIEARARTAEILLVILLAIFLFLTMVALFDIELSYLRPLDFSPKNSVKGSLKLGYMFSGLECLLLVSPFLCKGDARKSVITAIFCAGGITLVICLVTLAKFGPVEILHQPWPVMRLMDMINLPGSFIAWQNAFVMSFWVLSAFALCNAFIYFSALLARDMAGGRGKHGYFIWVSAAAVFAVSCLRRQNN
jgi:spore germination protein